MDQQRTVADALGGGQHDAGIQARGRGYCVLHENLKLKIEN
jgi:acetoin utilization deacetylase AcuC-like enzyme